VLPLSLAALVVLYANYRPFATESLVLGSVLEDLPKLLLAELGDGLLVVVETSTI